MKTKKGKQYSFEHTKLRLLQRYGIDITMDDYDAICHMIKHNICTTLIDTEKQKDDTQYIYDLKWALNPILRVVWSDKRQRITTALKRS